MLVNLLLGELNDLRLQYPSHHQPEEVGRGQEETYHIQTVVGEEEHSFQHARTLYVLHILNVSRLLHRFVILAEVAIQIATDENVPASLIATTLVNS